jgi:2-amino-4-hydroxy-6-hydroxymethyldihydropteridine diphosphokinase
MFRFRCQVTVVLTRAILALGGNLGDIHKSLLGAISALGENPDIEVNKVSSFYASNALTLDGIDKTKPDYLNAVIEVLTTLDPQRLLAVCNQIEQGFGRVRLERWASRTIDIDIITFGEESIETESLSIPHPRAFERAFVLVPWAQIDPDASLLGHGKVSVLANSSKDQVWVFA